MSAWDPADEYGLPAAVVHVATAPDLEAILHARTEALTACRDLLRLHGRPFCTTCQGRDGTHKSYCAWGAVLGKVSEALGAPEEPPSATEDPS